jgi:phospholipase/carboxylesterase
MLNVYVKGSPQQVEACIIWMHGLGADSSDMAGLVEQLPLDNVALRHVFIDAPVRPITINGGIPMRAWYDIIGMQFTDREDQEGILLSQSYISQVIDAQIKEGLSSNQIMLAGFSQGGAMALYTALHLAAPLAAVIVLSAYLPLAAQCKPVLAKNTPIFLAGGQDDSIVSPTWTKQTAAWLAATGYEKLTFHEYPMDHIICTEEMTDLAHWIRACVKGDF